MSALTTTAPGLGVNRPVPAPAVVEIWPICEPDSDEPPASMTIAPGNRASSRCLTPVLNSAPPLTTALSADRSHSSGARASRASASGLPNASPTMSIEPTCSRPASRQASSASKCLVVEDMTNFRPEHNALNAEHCAAPCIRAAHDSEPGPPACARATISSRPDVISPVPNARPPIALR